MNKKNISAVIVEKRKEEEALERRIGYKFKNPLYLRTALSHSSYVNEMSSKNKAQIIKDYERLEFLGDAVLEMVVSEYLFLLYPDMKEGDMTKKRASLVREEALFSRADDIDIKSAVLLGKGEEKGGGRNRASIISDAIEALIGALFLDGGIDCASKFIHDFILKRDKETASCDYKTVLQELVQSSGSEKINYRLISTKGPEHARVFESSAILNGKEIGRGEGSSKKLSEQEAAKEALSILGKNP